MPSKYLYRVQARRRNDSTNDVQRGLQVGQEVGKLLGGLAGAIKGAQADSMANKLMNTQNAPRAALVSPGGTYQPDTGGPQPAASSDGSTDTVDSNADLSTDLPSDVSTAISTQGPPPNYSNPSTGNIEPLQGVDSTISGENTATTLSDGVGAAKTAAALPPAPSSALPSLRPGPGLSFVANAPVSSAVSTAGTAPFTGGVAGMKMQQEFQKSQLADQLQKLQLQRAQRDAASAADEDAGTGRFALDAAQKRANLERTLAENAQIGKPKAAASKAAVPDVPVGQEPLVDDASVAKHFPALSKLVGSDDTAVDTTSQKGYAVFGPKDKPDKVQKVPLADVQVYFKQLNARRKIQGLPLLKVPGEAESLGDMIGSTADNPYPVQSNLDALSRAKGTFIRLPNGQVKQVP